MDSSPLGPWSQGATVESLKEALPPIEGTYLVLAGPGTGKTALLVERARQIFRTAGASRIKVLALTFTNKAAAEMKSRLAGVVSGLDERSFIGTFHSFASHVLRAHGSAIGIPADFVIYNEDDQREVLRQLQSDGRLPEGLDPDNIVYTFSKLKSRGLFGGRQQEEEDGISETLRSVHNEYRRALRDSNALDFGDLILETARLFAEQPQILRLYRVAYRNILVDEFQDTTPAQYSLLHQLADSGTTNVFAVADEDQLIFEWNEARLETLNLFCEDFGAKVIYSTLTYRCPPVIVEAANAVIRNNRFRFPGKPEIRSRAGESGQDRIFVYEANDESGEGQFVADTINQLRGRGHVAAEFAVIARTRRLLDPIEQALLPANIPAGRPTPAGLGRTYESEGVLRLLRWLQNSRDEQSARRAVRFLRPEESDAFERAVEDAKKRAVPFEASLSEDATSKESPGLREIAERIIKWRLSVRDTQKLLEVLRDDLSSSLEFAEDSESSVEEVRRVLDELLDLCKTVSSRGRITLPDFLLSLPQTVARVGMASAGREGVVSLLTYHQAKGLEFPVIFLIALESGTFPDFRSEKNLRLLEEERRLFYVGITRTKSRLYLTYSRQRRDLRGRVWPKDASRFIGEIPAELVEHVYNST